MTNRTRRDVLKGTAGVIGSIALGPQLVSAGHSTNQFIVDVGDRVSRIDMAQIENADLDVVHELENIGYVVVKGERKRAKRLDYDWVPDLEMKMNMPEQAGEPGNRSREAIEQTTASPNGFGSYSPPDDWAIQWDKQRHRLPEALEHADGSGTQVAVIDTGVTASHPDLNVSPDVSDGGVSRNMSSLDNEKAGIPYGGYHGTHVAGIIGATGDGAIGNAPGTEIVDCRVFTNTGATKTGDIIAAIHYAADIGVDVINLSLGSLIDVRKVPKPGILSYVKLYQAVLDFANDQDVFVAVAAGNDSTDLDSRYLSMPSEVGNVANVSATGPIGFNYGDPGLSHPTTHSASYSNTGGTTIDVAAAGGDVDWNAIIRYPDSFHFDNVYSTYAKWDHENDQVTDLGYAWLMGTSMAAPQVAGAAALVRDKYPNASAEEIFDMMIVSAETGSARGYTRDTHGHGFLNLANLMEAEPGDAPTGSGRGGSSGRGGRSGRGPGRGDNYGDDTTGHGSGRGGRSGRG